MKKLDENFNESRYIQNCKMKGTLTILLLFIITAIIIATFSSCNATKRLERKELKKEIKADNKVFKAINISRLGTIKAYNKYFPITSDTTKKVNVVRDTLIIVETDTIKGDDSLIYIYEKTLLHTIDSIFIETIIQVNDPKQKELTDSTIARNSRLIADYVVDLRVANEKNKTLKGNNTKLTILSSILGILIAVGVILYMKK